MGYIRLEMDDSGIVELIMDQPGQAVNTMGEEYQTAMAQAITDLQSMVAKGDVKGIYVRSGKPTFFGGGDLNALLESPNEVSEEETEFRFRGILESKRPLRILETLGVPVAVGINGAALGGGYEICLACHHRIAIDRKGVEVGLPEAQLGLMPGAGGMVRMVRKFGVQQAITWISAGRKFKAAKALELGWVDELASDEDDMHAKAKAWLLANPEASQPWDCEGFKIPGGSPADKEKSQELEGLLYLGPVNVMNSTNGNMPAPKIIFACAADVARVDFDTAERIEARYFLKLMGSQVAKNMIRTFFFQLGAINKGGSRPKGIEKSKIAKIGVLGAGQMGAGIALCAAQNGIEVVLKDVTIENAERGKGYCIAMCKKNKRMSPEIAEQVVARVHPSADYSDFNDCDVVIEAVFEDRRIKALVTGESEAATSADCVFASNTSALPITELAGASSRPENFIGMHFFSPAERMPLVEIICGEKTSQDALAKAFDLAKAMGKTPIVVNDAPGFFTTRVIGATITDGAQMVMEGINPVLIENAAKFNGSPVGPLAAIDEISQETAYKNGLQAKADAEAMGKEYPITPTWTLLERMVNEFGRRGKVHGGGYYEYPEGGKKFIWPGLGENFAPDGFKDIPFDDIKDRLTFSQSLEAVKAMEEGVINTAGEGNVGSIFGIGFPPHTGGVFQFINAWGLKAFVARARDLASKYGTQFEPPQLLIDRAERDEPFI